MFWKESDQLFRLKFNESNLHMAIKIARTFEQGYWLLSFHENLIGDEVRKYCNVNVTVLLNSIYFYTTDKEAKLSFHVFLYLFSNSLTSKFNNSMLRSTSWGYDFVKWSFPENTKVQWLTVEVIHINHMSSMIRLAANDIEGVSPNDCSMRRRPLRHEIFWWYNFPVSSISHLTTIVTWGQKGIQIFRNFFFPVP